MTTTPVFQTKTGLTREVVEEISRMKDEPPWMLEFRLKGLQQFLEKPLPTWGGDLSAINFDAISYHTRPDRRGETSEDLPGYIKDTFDRLGIPEAERNYPAGARAQYDADAVYDSLRQELVKQGVTFLDTDAGLREHPDLFERYFGTLIPPSDNKFAALNSAVWSGGNFVFVPSGVQVEVPLEASFRINAARAGRFERTFIIAEEGSCLHYLEGCTAPSYAPDSLRSAVVEIFVKKGARVRYTAIQNWSHNVYNLVTKRAAAYQDARMEWIDCNLGSRLTMKYPSVYLMEPGARGEVLSVAFAGHGQHQDVGGKVLHMAPNTSSSIVVRSISQGDGHTSYRGLVKVYPGARDVKSSVRCDALILDEDGHSDIYPTMEIDEDDVTIGHEATVSRLGEEQLFYLMSRGLSETEAATLIVNGFIEPIVKELPMEYAVELNRLIQLQMADAVG